MGSKGWGKLCALIFWGISPFVSADVGTGLQWLAGQSQVNAGISASNDIAIPFQSTAEALRALSLNGQSGTASAAQARDFIAGSIETSTEHLARKIIAAGESGASASTLIAQLTARQDPLTGGFGSEPGSSPSTIDTAYALEALGASGIGLSDAAVRAFGYLITQQLNDGSWREGDNESSLPLTSLSVSALGYYANREGVNNALQKGSAYLLAGRQANGLWQDDFSSALALIAIGRASIDREKIANSLQVLRSRQSPNGSWQSDVFITSLALRALAVSEGSIQLVRGEFSFSNVTTPATGAQAGQQQIIGFDIANNTNDSRNALIIAYVLDASGKQIAVLTPYAANSTTPQAEFSFGGQQSVSLQLPWNPNLAPPGTYQILIAAVRPNSITGASPRGDVIEEVRANITVVETRKISGMVLFDPPLVQAGSQTPVSLRVLVNNAGNVDLNASSVSVEVKDAGLNTVFSASSPTPALQPGKFAYVELGVWTPESVGNLGAKATVGQVPGLAQGTLYVGNKANAQLSVDRQTLPVGTQTVRANVQLSGIPAESAVSADPYYIPVKQAIQHGAAYVGPAAVQWGKTHGCTGCHIQTQSLLGLAKASKSTLIDTSYQTYLVNELVFSQRPGGEMTRSHSGYNLQVQTALGLWSLSEWPQPASVVRMQNSAAAYLHSQLQVDGNKIYFIPTDDSGGWWKNNIPAMNMLAVKGFAGLIKNLDVLQGQIPVYTAGAEIPSGVTYLNDISYANGYFYSTGAFGPVARVEALTGAVTEIGGMTRSYAITTTSDNVVYWTGESTIGNYAIARIKPGQVGEVVAQTTEAGFGDITVSPAGEIFVTQPALNKVLRLEPSGALTVVAQGAPLDQPLSLAFASDGSLFIGNYGNGEILKRESTGEISRASPGYPDLVPRWMAVDPLSNDVLIQDSRNGVIWKMHANGVLSVVSTASSVYPGAPVFTENGDLYLANQNHWRINKWERQNLASSATLLDDLMGIVRYTLATYQEPTSNNLTQAWRLITLGEGRPYVSDPSLLAQVDSAMANLSATLRQRQQADGGWVEVQNVSTSSDALVTSAVGMAIDYMKPSPSDPTVRNSVAFLLQNQRPNYSWPSNNSIFSTDLAATSFVMAYLPVALDLLGTIDSNLFIVTPPNIRLSNATESPHEVVPSADGSVTHQWQFSGLDATNRNVGFDLTIENLRHNEVRPIASAAYLTFKNTFTDAPLRSDLQIPAVHATSGLGLLLATDQLAYSANTPVTITATVGNSGVTATSHAQLFVRAVGETVPIADLGSLDYESLPAGQTVIRSTVWNTSTYRSGQYEIFGRLTDDTGNQVDEAVAVFSIGTEGNAASASVTTNKTVYRGIDQVGITARIRNLSLNTALSPSKAVLTVSTPTGAVLFTKSVDLAELPIGALHDELASVPLNRAPAGVYTVRLDIKDKSTDSVLVSATSAFNVVNDAVQDITGSVAAQQPSLIRGQSEQCIDKIENIGSLNYTNLNVRQLVGRLDQEGVVGTPLDHVIAINAGHSESLTRTFSTGPMSVGDYACVLQVQVVDGGEWNALAFAPFKVMPEPIMVQSALRADKQTYARTASATLTTSIRNATNYRTEPAISVQIRVVDPLGVVVFSEDRNIGDLSPGATAPVVSTYSFSGAAEGSYIAHAYIFNAVSEVISTAQTMFSVQGSLDESISGSVGVKYASREQGESQTCTDGIRNARQSAVQDLQLRQILERTDQSQIIRNTPTTVTVAGLGEESLVRVFDTQDLTAGFYACRLDAKIDGQWKTLASAPFEVKPVPVRVDASLSIGPKGRLLALIDSASKPELSSGPCEQRNLGLRLEAEFDPPLAPDAVVTVKLLGLLGNIVDVESISLLAFDGELNKHVSSTPIDLSIPYVSADGVTVQLTGKTAQQLLGDQYRILVTASDATRTVNLSTGTIDVGCGVFYGLNTLLLNSFRVVGLGPKNLTDVADAPGDGTDTRTAAQQKTYLEGLLQQKKWSYKIVTDAASFTSEMRTGGYSAYALLSEYIVLSEQAQKELREAVHRGDGLFVAGRHDLRNHILDDALGIKFKGTHNQATGVRVLPSAVFSESIGAFTQTDGLVQRVRQLQGTKLGQVIRNGSTPNDSIVIGNTYRQGKSVIVGFDALAEATHNATNSPIFADILTKSLDHVHPSTTTPQGGRVVPVRLSLDNKAQATTTTVVITTAPSPGSYIIAASAGTLVAGKVTWTPNLAVGDAKTLDVWISLPSGGIPVTVSANLKATVNGTLTDLGTTTYSVTPTVQPGLDDAITHLQAYVSTLPVDNLGQLLDPTFGTRPPAQKALERLLAARQALVAGYVQLALIELVAATDHLMLDAKPQIPPIRLEVDRAMLEVGQLQ